MENIVTRPVNMVRLGNQSPGFAFQENGSVYMLTDLDPIKSEHCEVMQAMNMATGRILGFSGSEYYEPVYVFTVHAKGSLARSERIVKDL